MARKNNLKKTLATAAFSMLIATTAVSAQAETVCSARTVEGSWGFLLTTLNGTAGAIVARIEMAHINKTDGSWTTNNQKSFAGSAFTAYPDGGTYTVGSDCTVLVVGTYYSGVVKKGTMILTNRGTAMRGIWVINPGTDTGVTLTAVGSKL